MSDPQDFSRRSFVLRASATVAVSAGAMPSVMAADKDTAGLADLGAGAALARMARGELSAERYARDLPMQRKVLRNVFAILRTQLRNA